MKYKNPISFLILFFLLSVTCFSQSIVPRANSSYTVMDSRGMWQYNAFIPRYEDSVAANLQKGIDTCGAVVYLYATHTLWYRSCAGGTKAWVDIGLVLTASQGITKVGSDFQLGGTLGSETQLFSNRFINMGSKSINFHRGPALSDTSDRPSYFNISATDTLSSQNQSLRDVVSNFTRTIRVTGPYYTDYINGFRMALTYQGADSVPIDTKGGDFGGGVVNELRLEPLATHNDRTVFRGGIADLIPVEAPFGGLSQLVVKGHSGARSYLRGYFTGHTSLFVMDSGQPDTLENFIHYGGRGYAPSPSKVLRSFFMRPTALVGDSVWFLYDSENYKSYLTGSVAIGGTTGTAAASALLDVTSTTKGILPPRMTAAQRSAIGSPASALFLWDSDSTRYMGYNGTSWKGIAWTGEGGGGGSGTVNSGTQYRLGYYATTGDAISEAAAITGDRALISDANGVPTHSVTTATELGYVNGVTSAIQTQIDTKAADALVVHIAGTETITGAKTFSSAVAVNSSVNLTSAGGVGTGINVTSTGSGATMYSSIDYINHLGTRFQTGLRSSAGSPAQGAFFYQPGAFPISFYTTGIERLRINGDGNIGFQQLSPTAKIHIAASATGANTGQIKLGEGSRQTTPEDGTINYVANNLEFTETSTVYTLAKTLTSTAALDFASTGSGAVADLTITVTGAADGDAVSLGVPNASVTATATYTAWVSAANTVTVRFSPKATEDPASGTFRVSVIKY